jgi:hypothetical protein
MKNNNVSIDVSCRVYNKIPEIFAGVAGINKKIYVHV